VIPELVLNFHTARAGLGVERPESYDHVCRAEEHEAAAGGEDGAPVHGGELVSPDPLPRLHVPGLELADVTGALAPAHRGLRAVDAQVELAGLVGIGFGCPTSVVQRFSWAGM